MPIRLATVFSGIGAIEFAFKRLGIAHDTVFACDNGERDIEYDEKSEKAAVAALPDAYAKKEYVDRLYASKTRHHNYVKDSYLANYPELPEARFYEDVKLLDGTDFAGQVDLFVGGSPCQSFSSVGFQKGLEDARGTLFYHYARLISEIRPRVFIYENVRNLINHDGGNTWEIVKGVFDSLGYHLTTAVLNASDFGIPQTRRRLFVVGFLDNINFAMPTKTGVCPYTMKDFSINNCALGNFTTGQNGEISINPIPGIPNPKYILTPRLYAYVMKGGTKTFFQRPEINKDIARTVLKTMGNRHRAGIDNYMSFDGTENLGSVRMLTEREALRLMGYTDDYQIVVSRAQAYKQAGNSIVVDVMMAVLKQIIATGVFDQQQ
jgi:DNA (cytosine-5)-methyltransferase 1